MGVATHAPDAISQSKRGVEKMNELEFFGLVIGFALVIAVVIVVGCTLEPHMPKKMQEWWRK